MRHQRRMTTGSCSKLLTNASRLLSCSSVPASLLASLSRCHCSTALAMVSSLLLRSSAASVRTRSLSAAINHSLSCSIKCFRSRSLFLLRSSLASLMFSISIYLNRRASSSVAAAAVASSSASATAAAAAVAVASSSRVAAGMAGRFLEDSVMVFGGCPQLAKRLAPMALKTKLSGVSVIGSTPSSRPSKRLASVSL